MGAAVLAFFCLIPGSKASIDTSHSQERFERYYNSTWRLVAINPRKALDTARLYYRLAKAKKDSYELGYAYTLMGFSHYHQNHNDSALYLFGRARKVFRALPDSAGLSEALYYMGLAQIYRGQFAEALSAFRRSYQIDTALGYPPAQALYHFNIGTLLSEQQAYQQALPLYRKALKAMLRDSLTPYQLPGLYLNIAECLLEENRLQGAQDTLRLARQAAQRYEDKASLSTFYALMAAVNREKGAYQQARRYLDTAYAMDTAFGDPYIIAADYQEFALLHLAEGRIQKALAYIRKVRDMPATRQVILLRRDVYKTLARIEAAAGNPQKAYAALQRHLAIKDTLQPLDTYYQVFQLEKQVNEKELALSQAQSRLQAEKLERKNTYLLFSLAALLLALVLLVIFYRLRRRLKQSNTALQQRNAEIEKQRGELDRIAGKLRQQKESLEKLNQSKNRLFSILAHDLKQPFQQLIQTIELVEEGEMSAAEREELLQQLKQNVQRTSEMVNNLLTWSKAQFAGSSVAPETVNLSALVKKQVLQLSSVLEEKALDIQVDLDPQTYVWVDPEHLAIIVRNILHNAVKYSFPQGRINLTAQAEEPQAIAFHVRDEGRGMPPDKVEELMRDKDQQSEPGTLMESGTGLGLLIIKELLAENKGRLHIQSQPEQGSVFTIILPKSTPQAETTAAN
jgi:signal transduction histidine kinase